MRSRLVTVTAVLALVVVLSSIGEAQFRVNVEDSVSTVINQIVTLPRNIPEIRTHAIKPTYEVDVFTDAFAPVRQKLNPKDNADIIQQKAGKINPTTGSATYVYVVKISFPDTGFFFVRRTFRAGTEMGRGVRDTTFWKVRVRLPRLINTLQVPPTLYYGETRSINFATREYADAQSYSYRIEGGGTTMNGLGSLVRLDSIINNVRIAGNNTQFVVRGFYEGRSFAFLNPQSSRIDSTVWRFTISPPTLEVLTSWDKVNEFIEGKKLLDIRNTYDFAPTQWRFVFTQRVGNSWLQVPLVPQSIEVSSRLLDDVPTNRFVGGLLQSGRPFRSTQSNFWYIMDLQTDSLFLSSIPEGRYANVELTVTGRDQFGRPINVVRRASIF